MEKKKRNIFIEKIMSRKFQVWLVWTVLSFFSLFIKEVPKETIFTYYGLVSLLYIGGNVATQFSPLGKKEAATKTEEKNE